ncbi:expressed unknown protein [Seminavis robusta]|uniref:Uncharacterized protein n=1 Tax=Seminavis robusta TaxID=568900 RepID=A0A9N8DZC3_9STRA|nr:expressed unknown protein [Seminavis robusta]|eukprot:Sro492_g153930.1 n/a (221) ;mRNA; f:47215-48010
MSALLTTSVVSVGVYLCTRHEERHSNTRFRFVTLPDFALRGSQFRAQWGSHIVHWLPLVQEEQRDAWEEYSKQNRAHIDDEFATDAQFRTKQDAELLGHDADATRKLQDPRQRTGHGRNLREIPAVGWRRRESNLPTPPPGNMKGTALDIIPRCGRWLKLQMKVIQQWAKLGGQEMELGTCLGGGRRGQEMQNLVSRACSAYHLFNGTLNQEQSLSFILL